MGRVASAPEGFLRGRGVGGERMRMEEPGGPEVRRADFASSHLCSALSLFFGWSVDADGEGGEGGSAEGGELG